MISRRAVLLGAALAATGLSRAAASLPIPASGRLGFSVIRGGKTIGAHELTFETAGASLVVRVAVELVVKFGPVPLYRYRHDAVETWGDGAVVSLEATTNANGRFHFAMAEATPDGLRVTGSSVGPYVAPPGASPATHWNRAMLDGALIHTQDGRLMRPSVEEIGLAPIPSADGGLIEARGYALRGDVTLDTWYEDTPLWAGLRFTAEDGSEILYRRN